MNVRLVRVWVLVGGECGEDGAWFLTDSLVVVGGWRGTNKHRQHSMD